MLEEQLEIEKKKKIDIEYTDYLTPEQMSTLTKTEQRRIVYKQFFADFAHKKGGKLLSEQYINMHTKMEFQCILGHKFKSTGHSLIQKNAWCPSCAGNKRLTIKDCHEVAREHNGHFLSSTYLGMREPHPWACENGHVFEQTPQCVIHNKIWCPICTKAKRQEKHRQKCFNQIKSLVQQDGIAVLSKNYIGNRVEMLFLCSHGHTFGRTPEQLKLGKRCPECKINKRFEDDDYE